MKKKQNTASINRRSFLKRSWLWLGVIAGVELTAITFSMFSPGKRTKAANSYTSVKTAGYVGNIKPGSVSPHRNGQFYLVRMNDGGFLAVSLTCTHLGCSVGFDAGKKQFICPCHSSVFSIGGDVLSPPAPRALDIYRVFIEQGQVKVDTDRKIRRKKFSKADLVYA